MKITIIGAGNTAVAAACFLKTLGLSSLIYTRREERAKQWNQFPVKASGACTGSFSLESTTDLKTANIDAGQLGGLLVSAHGIKITAMFGKIKEKISHKHTSQHDNDNPRRTSDG